jgi:hypothetical protein
MNVEVSVRDGNPIVLDDVYIAVMCRGYSIFM